uniref:Mid2 domain-containing protein n=1 Tax=Bionectria ochroleuca TaxID=29856 RepID=A0A8H7NPH7_BIOOC
MGRGRIERRRNVALLTLLSLSSSLVAAQSSCISLQNSSACPAFKTASISRDDLKKEFPFLEYVKDTSSFDDALSNYVKTTFVHDKYQNLFGCGEIDLTNTTTWYARFTTTVMCNALVQKSINACSLSKDQSRSICADGCAEFAQSEAYLTSDRELCANPKDNLDSLIRADFTTCSEPLTALAGRTCINPSDNEKENCGFGTSTIGLCAYCSDTSVNSTDTCCYNSNAEQRCQGIKLPVISTTMSFDTPTGTASPSSTADPSGSGQGGSSLSGGAIAGIVVGAIAGLALLGVVLFFCIRRMKRSKGSQSGSIFNQPSPARKGPRA